MDRIQAHLGTSTTCHTEHCLINNPKFSPYDSIDPSLAPNMVRLNSRQLNRRLEAVLIGRGNSPCMPRQLENAKSGTKQVRRTLGLPWLTGSGIATKRLCQNEIPRTMSMRRPLFLSADSQRSYRVPGPLHLLINFSP